MIDDSDRAPAAGGHMTLWEHLAELRSRIVKCVIAVALGAVVGWVIFGPLLEFLQKPFCDLIARRELRAHRHRPARRLHPAHPDVGLRRHRAGHAGAALAALAVRHPGPLPEGEEVRPAVHVRRRCCSSSSVRPIAYLTLNPALQFLISVGGRQDHAVLHGRRAT